MAASGYRQQPKKKKSIFLRIALIVFALYAVVVLVQLGMEIRAKEQTLADIQLQKDQIGADNQGMQEDLDDPDGLLGDAAHDSGYINSGDGVYKESN